MIRFKSLLFVVLALLLALPIFAQGDLSDEELALLDRLADASDATEDATSFVSTFESMQNQDFNISFGDTVQAISEAVSVTAERVVTRGDAPYGSAFYTVEITQSDGLSPEISYEMEIEFRYVDGMLYAQGAYVESEGDVPPLEEGWVIAENAFSYPFLNGVDVEELLELFTTGEELGEDEEEESLLEAIAVIRDQATSVTLEEVEVEGVPLEAISITFGWDGLLAILETEDSAPPEDDPIFGLFEEQLAGVGDVVTVIFLIDEEDVIFGIAYEASIEISDIDMGELDATAAGATIDLLALELFQGEIRTQIGEAFDVPEIPEVAAAG